MPMSDHPVDIVDECAAKLALLNDCLSHSNPDCRINLSPRAMDGLFYFLIDIETELRGASPHLCVKPQEVPQ